MVGCVCVRFCVPFVFGCLCVFGCRESRVPVLMIFYDGLTGDKSPGMYLRSALT
jgi:hypothetical protein